MFAGACFAKNDPASFCGSLTARAQPGLSHQGVQSNHFTQHYVDIRFSKTLKE
jgi:hypothetical protein